MTEANNGFSFKDGVTLKEYVDLRFNEAQRAIDKAEQLMSARLVSMNEFRGQLSDQAATFLTRETYDAKHALLQTQVDDLRLYKAALDGKANQSSVTWAYFIGGIGLLLSVIDFVRHLAS